MKLLDDAGKSSPAKWIMILVVLAVVGIVAAYAFKNMSDLPTGDGSTNAGNQPMDVPASTAAGMNAEATPMVSLTIPTLSTHQVAGG